MMTFSPLTTCSKGRAKVGKSVWEDPATTFGRVHNVITDDELKGFSSISSHELVLGESLCLTTNYLSSEEKAKEKVKELKEALKIEKKLVIQKDEEVQAALLRTDKEREKLIAKFLESDRFSNMQFEQSFKGFELLCATEVVKGESATIGGANDEAQTEADCVEEIVNVP
nr:hypothetical protein CFP56_38163 [Quercus suber]